jgi:predicted RNase H-like HicB family nuclease
MIPYILYALLLISNSKAKTPEINTEKIKQTLEIMVEKSMVNSVLDSIANRETRYNVIGDRAYKLISSTNDYGRWQINGVHFLNGGICQGITYQEFLNSPALQEQKAKELMALHIRILRQYGQKITPRKLHLGWFGISVALYNN